MKHNIKVISLLVLSFLLSQLIGLFIVDRYIDHQKLEETGEVAFVELPYDVERPPIEEDQSVWYIISAILIGTVILLVIIHFNRMLLWKIWYFLSVFITLVVAFAAFINEIPAAVIAFILALVKIIRPGIIIHNLTEIFIYGGLAAIFVPIMSLSAAAILLILISIYDMYAVWKSRHMIKLAEFTTRSKIFAGLSIPYAKDTGKLVSAQAQSLKPAKKSSVRNAILGGGDIGFPLLFAGVVMKSLMLSHPVLTGFLLASIIPLLTAVALAALFMKGEKNKFYPAMPFLSVGCFMGYAVIILIDKVFF